uniref:Uncharacterized protein n=1 Tax=Glossina pallidipes TaxID=7398 RepID=A0A1B0AFJ9_GLOPL
MSIHNNITFEKLKSMQINYISNCITSTSALQICRESRADADNIYHFWVHKLFQAYDISKLQYNDWFQIIAYLKSLVAEMIKDTTTNQSTLRTLNLLAPTKATSNSTETTTTSTKEWKLLSDTQQLLTRFETIITNSETDVAVWSLLISFTLEVIIMFLKTDKKGHMVALVIIQRRLLILITESIKAIKLKNGYEFEAVVQVLAFLCDVSSLLTSVNFKIAIESWRAVGKLSYTCLVLSKSFEAGKESLQNGEMIDWSMQPSLKILKEIKKCLQYLQERNDECGESFLKVISFYSKLLTHILCSRTLAVLREFLEIYILNKHILQQRNCGAIGKVIDQEFYEMFSKIYHEKEVGKFVVLHISEDASAHFLGCNFIQDYLTICLENHYQQQYFITNNSKFFLQIFFRLFETPLIYADCRKYDEILEYYVVLMLLDSSYCLHQHFCRCVLEEKWILAFTSSQVLKIYYSYQHSNVEYYVVCLEFWMKCLGHYTVYKFNERKFFIQDLTKSLIARIPEHMLSEQGDRLRELFLFVNDKHNVSHFSFRLDSDLQKLKTLNGNSMGIITKLNLLIESPKHINDSIMDSIVQVFEYLLNRPSCDYSRLQLFFNCCFKLFVNFSLENVNKKIMKCLEENDKNVISICSVFMLEFVIKYQKQLLYKILPEYLVKSVKKCIALLDVKFIKNESQREDLKIFLTLPKLNMELLPAMDCENHVRKKSYQDARPSYNVKTILNNILEQSIELKNMWTHFDKEDVNILGKIKDNIDKCYEI